MGKQDLKLFGKRLRELRVKKGVSQEKLAELAGMHRNYVSRLEKAEQSPTLDRIIDLAGALGVRPAQFFENKKK